MTASLINNASDAATPQQIEHYLVQATTAYRASKAAAAQTAAYLYMVSMAALSGTATDAARNNILDMIRDYDAKIALFNTEIVQLAERRIQFAAKAIDVADLDTRPELDSEHVAEYKRLVDIVANGGSFEVADHIKVKAQSGRKDTELLSLIKCTLRLDNAKDSSVATRYATVVTALQHELSEKGVNDVQDAIDVIAANGGFERMLLKARGTTVASKASRKTAADQTKVVANYIAGKLKCGIPATSVDLRVRAGDKELVLLFGCVNGSEVDVIDEFTVANFDSVIAQYRGDYLVASDEIRFLANVMRLGTLISSPSATAHTLAMLPADRGPADFIVSQVGLNASVVVCATPLTAAPAFTASNSVCYLDSQAVDSLKNELRDVVVQSAADIVVNRDENSLTWVVKSPLHAKDHVVNLEWVNIADVESGPNMVDGFTATFTTAISKADVIAVLDRRYSSSKPATDHNQTFALGLLRDKFAACTFGLPVPELDDQPKAVIVCREVDIHALFEALKSEHTDTFDFAIDDQHMLEITWHDRLGTYRVYVPAVDQDGTLNSARLTGLATLGNAPIVA